VFFSSSAPDYYGDFFFPLGGEGPSLMSSNSLSRTSRARAASFPLREFASEDRRRPLGPRSTQVTPFFIVVDSAGLSPVLQTLDRSPSYDPFPRPPSRQEAFSRWALYIPGRSDPILFGDESLIEGFLPSEFVKLPSSSGSNPIFLLKLYCQNFVHIVTTLNRNSFSFLVRLSP